MTPAARLAAAIEVLADILARRRPAPDALKEWGLAHRFAGSGDRAAIAGLAYDALRRKASAAFVMGDERGRGLAPQRVVGEAGDRRAVARAGEAMRQPPLLQGIGRGPAPRQNIGEHLDGGGKA